MEFRELLLRWLEERWSTLPGCPPPTEASALCKYLEARSGLAAGTIRSFLTGTHKRTPRYSTKEKLAQAVQMPMTELVPEFPGGRVDAAASADQLASEATEDSQVVSLTIPKQEPKLAQELMPWLCGLYICYRYSFEVSLEHLVAREVLAVWNDEGTLRFYLWYVRGGDVPGSKVEAFEGIVVPAGRTLMFVGTSEDRCRSLVLQYDSGPAFRFCRFGIMTSTKTRDPKVPVAACTVMIKLEGMPNNWKEWGTSGSGIIGVGKWEEIIEKDFDPNGTKQKVGNGESRVTHEEWIRRFLDNTPLVDPNTAKADSIMRLNMERFGLHMDLIRRNVLAATGGDVPFGMEWSMGR